MIGTNTLRLLMDAGLEGDALLAVVASIEADATPERSTDAERQARYRQRLAMPQAEWAALAAWVKERDKNTCGYCGATDGVMHVDHVIPLIQGGSSDPHNLITACQMCNTSKSGRTPEQWRGEA